MTPILSRGIFCVLSMIVCVAPEIAALAGEVDKTIELQLECTREVALEDLDRLCHEGVLPRDAYRRLRNCLLLAPADKEVAERAQRFFVETRTCRQLSKGSREALRLAELMRLLAHHWLAHHNPDRADKLFELAFTLTEATPATVWKVVLLEDWTTLKLQSGDFVRARELACHAVKSARQIYATNGSTAELLWDTLKLKARALRSMGLLEEAAAADQEAKLLLQRSADHKAAQPSPVPN